MASGGDPCPEHPQATTHRQFRYCFYVAHHGRGSADDAQWAEDVSRDEEFAIFEEADRRDLSDESGNFYGLRPPAGGIILDLGTAGEQVAKFWNPEKNRPTHGFPLWPLGKTGPENRKKGPAPRAALGKMLAENLLTQAQYQRLIKRKRA